jgi:chaperone required for assembly of F1-ATPase
MKRFYKGAAAGEGNTVRLDGKPLRTPGGAALALPTSALADAVAEEWRAQGETVEPARMPLTRLANTAIDGVTPRREAVIAEILAFAHHDHLCYRADQPAELARRQSEAWDPLLDWAAGRFGARLATGTGIASIALPEEAIAAFGRALETRDAFALASLHVAASILGSLVLGLALAEGRLDAETAFALSQLDERYQAEKWGLDAEAEARAVNLAKELDAAARFMDLARSEIGQP